MRFLIFDTHPIQYRSPVFRAFCQRQPDAKVYFFNPTFDGAKWWFHEVGKIPKQDFALPLTEGFPNETIGTAALRIPGAMSALRRILETEKPEAVLTYGYYLPEHWMLRWLTARMGIPLIFVGETFSTAASLPRRLVKTPMRRYFFQGVSRFIAIGRKTADHYGSLGIPEGRIDRGKYCTDVSFFLQPDAAKQKVRAQWRRDHGIPADAFVILFVGRLFERKRPLDVFALHAQLADETSVHTVIVGNGPMESAIQSAAAKDSRSHFLGFQNQEQLKAIYLGVDLLFVPSEYETWGLVVNEACAAGTPALITDTCGVAGDLVVPGETGFVYPVGAVAEAARCVRTALKDPAAFLKMGKAAQKKVSTEYTIEGFAEVLQKSFLGAAKSGGG